MMANKNNEQEKIIQATIARRKNLAEWRANQRHEMDLPSGLHVTLRNVTMTDLLLTGKLPPSITDFFNSVSADSNEVDLKSLFQNAADFQVLLDTLVKIAIVEPQLADVADDDHISLAEIPNNDKMEIFNWVNRASSQLEPFREGTNQPSTPA
jgi:hypothetical protein